MSKSAIISVIIPCFNHGSYLKEALNSLLTQTFKEFEVIIVDDGSTDDTASLAKSYTVSDERIHYCYQSNAGLSSARNKGISVAKGEWIVLLDADDYLEPDALELIASHIKDKDVIVTGYQYVDEKGRLLYQYSMSRALQPESVLTGNFAPPVAISFRKSLLIQSGLFDEQLKSAEDWDLWIRLYKCGARFYFIPTIAANYRILQNSMSRNAFRMYENLKVVALRAGEKDNRLDASLPMNKKYETNTSETIKHCLLMCLGVSIMQSKHAESISLFEYETIRFQLKYKVKDFEQMCSYLSFRYRYSKQDTEKVLTEIAPLFQRFFAATSLSEPLKQAALKAVFKQHRMVQNRHRWGILAPVLNRLIV
jgi:glycosyltransferase involved in cell wall biosynthesis